MSATAKRELAHALGAPFTVRKGERMYLDQGDIRHHLATVIRICGLDSFGRRIVHMRSDDMAGTLAPGSRVFPRQAVSGYVEDGHVVDMSYGHGRMWRPVRWRDVPVMRHSRAIGYPPSVEAKAAAWIKKHLSDT